MSSQNTSTPSTNLSILSKGEHLYCIHGGYSNADPGAVALVSSQNAPEHTIIIPHEYTYVASDILLTLDCSVNICGCHLLHSLCNDPFYKPLHPPGLRPSPFLFRRMERFVEGVVAKCTKQMTTAYVVRAVEHLKDTACSIRIAMRDCSVHSGAFCESTSATAPGSEI